MTSSLGPNVEQAQQVYDEAKALDRAGRDRMRAFYDESYFSWGWGGASRRIRKAVDNAGRYEAAFSENGRWRDDLCFVVGGASAVLYAVVAHDLADSKDYARILRHWVKGGMTDPFGEVTR